MTASSVRQAVIPLLAALLLAVPATATDTPNSTATPTLEQLQEQLQRQQERLLELERLLKQQELLLDMLQQQLAALKNQLAPAPNPAFGVTPAAPALTPEQEAERVSGELAARAERSQPPAEKGNKQEKESPEGNKWLAEKLKGLGRFSFSGDVRLRYEPILGGALPRDRHRERIRLRFNAIAKLSDELTGGLTVASGDELDPISTNQTLTSFFRRKPFSLDRAFIQYHPNWFKPLTLTGGKFAYTWYRTELTFDNDLNPEGFSQALAFDFKNSVFKKLTLVGFQLPFRESGNLDDSFLHGGQIQSFWRFSDRVKFSGYAGFYNWHRADPVKEAQAAGALTGGANTNAATASQFASKFALLDLLGRLDIDTGYARWPVVLQLDFVNNTRPCTNLPATVVACNPRDRSGWWAEVQLGQTNEQHDLNFGYTFMRIEREAVLAAFNYSDIRQPTNLANHRLNFGYQAYKNVTLNFTALIGRALRTATSPVKEAWLKWLQFDVLYKF